MAGTVGEGVRPHEPWDDVAFRADLDAFAEGTRLLSRRFAQDAVLLARLADRVPREDWDTRGATAWTSFLTEVAVARRVSSQGAAGLVAEAQQLVALMPRTLALLQEGTLAVPRARALLEAARPCPPELVRLVDEQLAARAVAATPTRIRAAVDQLGLRHEVDAAAARARTAARGRHTRHTPLPDGQAEFALVGPALPLAQFVAALDTDARAWQAALRGTGDARGLDQLRFDLALHRGLAGHGRVVSTTESDAAAVDTPPADAAAGTPSPSGCGLPDPSAPTWWTDRRFSRPVRLDVQVPVTTALGLSDEPGWLAGYGWIAAPAVRELLPVAELRQLCVAADSEGPSAGQLVDVADGPVRPAAGRARAVLRQMATRPFAITDKTWRTESQHDPSPALAGFVALRDQSCDGPTGTPTRARHCDLDHDQPWRPPTADPTADPAGDPTADPTADPAASPGTAVHGDLGLAVDPDEGLLWLTDLDHPDGDPGRRRSITTTSGPTAAWNLRARNRRTHGLKHRGWTSVRTPTGTLWLTPAGQTVDVPA